jgi:hypothetical protein
LLNAVQRLLRRAARKPATSVTAQGKKPARRKTAS